jgi:hypothetical protein
MLSKEFIVEYKIHDVYPSADLHIIVDSHYLERFKERGAASHYTVGLMLRQLPRILDQLRQVELGHKVWVYRPSAEVAIGLQRNSDKKGAVEFVLRTVIPWAPHKDGRTEIITI